MVDAIQAQQAIDFHLKEGNEASVDALKGIGWQILIDSGLAVASVLVAVLDQVAPALAAFVPGWAAALVVAGLAALKVALSKYLAGKHTAAVVKAYATETPDVVKRAYGQS